MVKPWKSVCILRITYQQYGTTQAAEPSAKLAHRRDPASPSATTLPEHIMRHYAGLRVRQVSCPWVESSRDPWYTPVEVASLTVLCPCTIGGGEKCNEFSNEFKVEMRVVHGN